MKFFRCFKTDIVQGFYAVRFCFIAAPFLFAALIGALHIQTGTYLATDLDAVSPLPFSLGDILVSFTAGSKQFEFDYGEPVAFPVAWMTVYAVMLYVVLWYPWRDLEGMGAHILLASSSRWLWWLSKCAWVACCAIAFWSIAFIVAFLWILISHGEAALDVAWNLPVILELRLAQVPSEVQGVPLFLLGVVPLTISLCLMQLCLSLFMKPQVAFAALFSLLFLSAYVFHPLLMGNYLMAARSECLMMGGCSPVEGFLLALAISGISIVAGGFAFSRRDLIEKEV